MKDVLFQYNRFCDLVYHVLAHMPIDCDADVYDADYVRSMGAALGGELRVPGGLTEHYRDNFDRVAIVDFVPLLTCGVRECQDVLLANRSLTDEDKELFIRPFMELCDKESERYYPWWDAHHAEMKVREDAVCGAFTAFTDSFDRFFSLFDAPQTVVFSYSITRFGRACRNGGRRIVYLRFPETKSDVVKFCLQFLHECTHAVTDRLIESPLLMSDGSHDLSEYQVLLYDEYLIEKTSPGLLPDYVGFFGRDRLDESREILGKDRVNKLKSLVDELSVDEKGDLKWLQAKSI